jgi:hypothetical protein
MSLWRMSEPQREQYDRGEILRMPIGVFRCVGASAAEGDCNYTLLWEAPLEDWWKPKCPACMRPAVLVEVVARSAA